MKEQEINGTTFYQIEGASMYHLSRAGEVFGGRYKRMLKPAVSGKAGYLQYWLTFDDGSQRWMKAHRLVALQFIPNPEGKPEVNHKDGDKANNYAGNLEWATHKENLAHAAANALMRPRSGPGHYNYGRRMSEVTREKCRRAKDSVRTPKPTYTTPLGSFPTPGIAAQAHNTDWRTIVNYCKRGKDGWGYAPAHSNAT